MAPIEADSNYYNIDGRVISSQGRCVVSPGKSMQIEGKISTVRVSCNTGDDGGLVEVTHVADDVIKGRLFGLGGVFGDKVINEIGHSKNKDIQINGKYGSDRFSIKHNPYPSEKSPLIEE